MRRAARRDDNEGPIVDILRAHGASVTIIGEPVDLIVGYLGATTLMEVKKPKGPRGGSSSAKSTSRGGDNTYTRAQLEWRASWKGAPPVTVRTPAEALAAIGASAQPSCIQPALPHVGPRPGHALYRCAGCPLVFEERAIAERSDAITFPPVHWIEGDEPHWPLCEGFDKAATLVTTATDNAPAPPAGSRKP